MLRYFFVFIFAILITTSSVGFCDEGEWPPPSKLEKVIKCILDHEIAVGFVVMGVGLGILLLAGDKEKKYDHGERYSWIIAQNNLMIAQNNLDLSSRLYHRRYY